MFFSVSRTPCISVVKVVQNINNGEEVMKNSCEKMCPGEFGKLCILLATARRPQGAEIFLFVVVLG